MVICSGTRHASVSPQRSVPRGMFDLDGGHPLCALLRRHAPPFASDGRAFAGCTVVRDHRLPKEGRGHEGEAHKPMRKHDEGRETIETSCESRLLADREKREGGGTRGARRVSTQVSSWLI